MTTSDTRFVVRGEGVADEWRFNTQPAAEAKARVLAVAHRRSVFRVIDTRYDLQVFKATGTDHHAALVWRGSAVA